MIALRADIEQNHPRLPPLRLILEVNRAAMASVCPRGQLNENS